MIMPSMCAPEPCISGEGLTARRPCQQPAEKTLPATGSATDGLKATEINVSDSEDSTILDEGKSTVSESGSDSDALRSVSSDATPSVPPSQTAIKHAPTQDEGKWHVAIDASGAPVLRRRGRRQLRLGIHALSGTLSLITTLGAVLSMYTPLRWASVACTLLLASTAQPMLRTVPNDAPVPGTVFLAQHKIGFRLALHVICYSDVRLLRSLFACSALPVVLGAAPVVISLLSMALSMKLQDAFNWPIVLSILADFAIQCSDVLQPQHNSAAIAAFWNQEIVDDAFLHLTVFTCCVVSFLFTLSFRKVIPETAMYLLSGTFVCVEFGAICRRALLGLSSTGGW